MWAIPSPEQVGDNIHILRDLLGADLVDTIVQVVLSSEQVAFLEEIGIPGHTDTHGRGDIGLRGLIPKVEEALLAATIPGGPLDPRRPGGDAVWVMVIRAMMEVDPARASKLARCWCAHLTRLAWDNEPGAVTSILFAVAAYSVAFVEHHQGRGYQASRWAREADTHVVHEDSPELALLAYLRACRLWGGVDGKDGENTEITAYLCLPGSQSVPDSACQIRTRVWIGLPPPPCISRRGMAFVWKFCPGGTFGPEGLIPGGCGRMAPTFRRVHLR